MTDELRPGAHGNGAAADVIPIARARGWREPPAPAPDQEVLDAFRDGLGDIGTRIVGMALMLDALGMPPVMDVGGTLGSLTEIAGALKREGLRPTVDAGRQIIRAVCPVCRAGEHDALYRPLVIAPQGHLTYGYCESCRGAA